ncbi:IncP-type conjugative transfer protein TrbH [Metapseudomonas furukawaii]|uniref:IncP-type conjugative transfer protein n=1 Tax=Metapseudomonas furukawaii TaxID=1149133 RepID=A0AAD1C6Q8_METFU|nr:IncP-type conjugative transfer protein TrbH [Pseudomonas furukawaii]ELS26297.1 IncP-type conjugative transfer protein TrbH [Pseudomonas furukawaii]BAU77407.1 IncP-type conjugative transfer protein [Pseudomonas furukawaii]
MKRLIVAMALSALVGCASQQQFGAYAELPPGYREVMARDAVNQMAGLYPPASTRLSMALEPSDSFGQILVERLRLAGYAVQESPATPLIDAKALGYVMDTLDESTYRVTITVGGESLSRAYFLADHKLSPSGLWARKE